MGCGQSVEAGGGKRKKGGGKARRGKGAAGGGGKSRKSGADGNGRNAAGGKNPLKTPAAGGAGGGRVDAEDNNGFSSLQIETSAPPTAVAHRGSTKHHTGDDLSSITSSNKDGSMLDSTVFPPSVVASSANDEGKPSKPGHHGRPPSAHGGGLRKGSKRSTIVIETPRSGSRSSTATTAAATPLVLTGPKWKRYTEPKTHAFSRTRLTQIQNMSSSKLARMQKWVDYGDQGTSPLGPLLNPTDPDGANLQVQREQRLKELVEQGVPMYAQNSSVDELTEGEKRRSSAAARNPTSNTPIGLRKFRSRVAVALLKAKRRQSKSFRTDDDGDGDAAALEAAAARSRRKSRSVLRPGPSDSDNKGSPKGKPAGPTPVELETSGNEDEDEDIDEDDDDGVNNSSPQVTGSMRNLEGQDGNMSQMGMLDSDHTNPFQPSAVVSTAK